VPLNANQPEDWCLSSTWGFGLYHWWLIYTFWSLWRCNIMQMYALICSVIVCFLLLYFVYVLLHIHMPVYWYVMINVFVWIEYHWWLMYYAMASFVTICNIILIVYAACNALYASYWLSCVTVLLSLLLMLLLLLLLFVRLNLPLCVCVCGLNCINR